MQCSIKHNVYARYSHATVDLMLMTVDQNYRSLEKPAASDLKSSDTLYCLTTTLDSYGRSTPKYLSHT